MLQVAQVLKSNGTDGELVLGFREIAPEDINLQEPVFIVFDGLPVPFFIESFTRRGNTKALVRLTGIRSQEDVEEIAGKAVYIEDDSLAELSLEDDGFAALVGWVLLAPVGIPDQVGDDEGMAGDDGEMAGEDGEMVGEDGEMVGEDGEMAGDDEGMVGDDEGMAGDDEGMAGEDGGMAGEDGEMVGEDGEMELCEVGEITDFIDIPNNPCIEVETENGAVMIPLHEDLSLSVDPTNREIIMQIPEGLL